MGLATAYSIIKNHGGYITAKSILNVGTILYIYLPASKKKDYKKNEEEGLPPSLVGKGKVLVMDDEEVIRDLLYAEFTDIGYEVKLTNDGVEAIVQYTKAIDSGQRFDAVIMDLTIPGGMGGKEAIVKLLEIDPKAKVIVSSGYATDPIIAEYKKYGFIAVVTKPYNTSELEKTLRRVLVRGKN